MKQSPLACPVVSREQPTETGLSLGRGAVNLHMYRPYIHTYM